MLSFPQKSLEGRRLSSNSLGTHFSCPHLFMLLRGRCFQAEVFKAAAVRVGLTRQGSHPASMCGTGAAELRRTGNRFMLIIINIIINIYVNNNY